MVVNTIINAVQFGHWAGALERCVKRAKKCLRDLYKEPNDDETRDYNYDDTLFKNCTSALQQMNDAFQCFAYNRLGSIVVHNKQGRSEVTFYAKKWTAKTVDTTNSVDIPSYKNDKLVHGESCPADDEDEMANVFAMADTDIRIFERVGKDVYVYPEHVVGIKINHTLHLYDIHSVDTSEGAERRVEQDILTKMRTHTLWKQVVLQSAMMPFARRLKENAVEGVFDPPKDVTPAQGVMGKAWNLGAYLVNTAKKALMGANNALFHSLIDLPDQWYDDMNHAFRMVTVVHSSQPPTFEPDVMAKLDTNHNGSLSLQELQQLVPS